MQKYLFALALAACGGTGPAPAAPSPAPAPVAASCDAAATNATKFVEAGMPADKIRIAMAKHCGTDAWSAELRACLAAAKTMAELDPCSKLFTPDQEKAFDAELRTLAGG